MKKLALCVMAIMLVFSCGIPTQVEAKTVKQLQNEKNQLNKKTNDAKKALEDAKNQKKTVEQEIAELDISLTAATDELDKVEANLAETTVKLANSEEQLKVATAARETQLKSFQKRIKFIHENGSIGYLEVILESKSFNDFLTRMQYVNDIMNYDEKTLTELKANEALIDSKTKEIAADKVEIEALAVKQKEKTESLEKLKNQKTEVVKSYEKDAEKYEQLIASNEKASLNVERLIAEANAAARASAQNSGGGGSTFVYTGGKLNWPVPARSPSPSSLSSGYVSRSRPIGRGSEFHTGYDIPAPYGSNIVAAEAGTVITAGWVNGYGNTVIINHGNGLSTLYGHNSKLVVSKGQAVTRGQVIAKCGSTGNSTGNHCHFEVRVNGKHTSPESYLGVTNISR